MGEKSKQQRAGVMVPRNFQEDSSGPKDKQSRQELVKRPGLPTIMTKVDQVHKVLLERIHTSAEDWRSLLKVYRTQVTKKGCRSIYSDYTAGL